MLSKGLVLAAGLVGVVATGWVLRIVPGSSPLEGSASAVGRESAVLSTPTVPTSPGSEVAPVRFEPVAPDLGRQLVGQWAVGDGYSKFGDLRMDFEEGGSMKLVRLSSSGGEAIEEPGGWRLKGAVVEMWSTNEDDQIGWTAAATVFAGTFSKGTFTPKGLSARQLTGEKLTHGGTFAGDLDLPFRCGVFRFSEPEFGRPDLQEAPAENPLRPHSSGELPSP